MKGSVVAASAALLGSVAASQHKAHAGFHMRRFADSEICTVYTTVYVTASQLPPVVANSTVYVAPTPVPEASSSESCTEGEAASTPIYTPVELSSTEVYTPPAAPSATEVYTPPAPPSSEAAYTPAPPPPSTKEPEPSKVEYSAPPAYTPSAPAKESPSKVHESETPKPTKPSGGNYSNGGRIVSNGDKWSMTFTPYASDGQCMSGDQIKTDIAKIADMGFTTIRSYSTDCGVFEHVVPAAQEHGLKVIYGIFLEAGGKAGKGPFSDYANEQLQAIIDNAPKDSVALIIVGNEWLFNNYGEASDLASYLDHVRDSIRSAGFPSDIAVTTTEPVNIWEEKGKALCDHIDLFTVQVHPFFDQGVTAEMAGDFAASQLEQAAKVCPEAAAKGKYISEIGWPKAGNTNGKAVPSKENQKIAIKGIIEKVGKEACIFSYQDDLWKENGPLNVEQNFGCADAL